MIPIKYYNENGVDFYLKKGKEWLSREKRSQAVILRAKTKREAILDTLTLLSSKTPRDIKKAIDFALHKRRVDKRANSRIYKRMFKNIFNIDLYNFKDMWLSAVIGVFQFDVIAFDKFIKTPDGTSCKDYVKQKCGDKALKMIERLI